MGFRLSYLFPSLFLASWWIYSILRSNNESAAYLLLYTVASIPVPLLFAILDKATSKSPIFQLIFDLVIFIGFYMGIKMIDRGVELWELLILTFLYSITIYIIALDRITGIFHKQ